MIQRTCIRFVVSFCSLLAAGQAWSQCEDQFPLSNTEGAGTVMCPCFVAGEEAGVVLDVPAEEYPIEIIRIGIAWGSVLGDTPNILQSALHVYENGLPNPGERLTTLEGPAFVDGFINEFDLEEQGGVRIESGPFTVTMEFMDANAEMLTAASMVHDGDGCQPGKNVVKAIPGGWSDACALGLSGDWVMHVIYRSADCGGEEPGGGKEPAATMFLRGDDNGDGNVDLSDPIFSLTHQFAGGPAAGCMESMDSNDDGQLNITDSIFTLTHLFAGGPGLPAPYPDCGSATGRADLGCETPPGSCN